MLLLGIFLYTRWRSYKGLKEGVYHVSAHHDGWEDIRENVLNYDEEGGGEEDQVSFGIDFRSQVRESDAYFRNGRTAECSKLL